ncbi:TIGR01620 family protein [Kangiella japonica]|uniref:TIGR01620 family protein n=1 Tax=Kangiella japonica TaxID=647384 RepID=A0ABN0SW57_9GAMM
MSDKPVKFYSSDKAHQKAEKLFNQQFEDSQPLVRNKSDSAVDLSVSLISTQQKSLLTKLFWPSLSAFVIFAAGYEAAIFITSLYNQHWLLGGGIGFLGGVIVLSGAYSLYKGWRARRRFKKRQLQKETISGLLRVNSYGQADAVLREVSDDISSAANIDKLKQDYDNRKQQIHNDQELIQIYSSTILKGLDSAAIDIVTKHATEGAAMVALSPLAAVDMALVAWRSSKMIQQLSQLYGCPQTALGRFEMTKRVFKNMMLAGASELVADAGVEMLGKGLTATISTKAAQGIGVGLLIARMGLQTMHLCRAVPYNSETKPKLSQVRKSVLSKVIGLIKSASSDKSNKQSEKVKQQEALKQHNGYDNS